MVATFVAVGDSFTEGMDDVRPDGTCRGWADLVAEALAEQEPGLQYANLAVRGRRLPEIVRDQVPLAVAMRPDLITIAAGGNDVIRPACDVDALGALFDRALGDLVDSGATVLAFAGFDPRVQIPLAGVPGRRADEYNAMIRSSARERGVLLVDMWDLPRLYEPGMWSPDRLHLSTAGHQLVAAEVLRVLGVPTTGVPVPQPGQVPQRSWLQQRAHDVEWGAVHFAPWVVRGIRGRTTGHGRAPKRPTLAPVRPPAG